VLYVAALFHDVAKGRGGDHSELGAVEVRRFCRDHGIDAEDDTRLIEFLVRHHLTMSRIAQKEDLSDPDVIPPSPSGGTSATLTALYLLTVADIRGTSPKVWNAWKGKLLEDLYRWHAARWDGGAAHARNRGRGPQARARRCWPCMRSPEPRSPSGTRWTWATSCATTPATSPGTRASCGGT
jgi:[protein-PII] uridylyltransferase